LYCVYVCIFVIYIEFFPYCLFVSNSQVIGCEDRLRNDLYCVGLGVKLYSIQSNLNKTHICLSSNFAIPDHCSLLKPVVIHHYYYCWPR